MDCVTCLLMGMCMLCGKNFGASAPGRPMTESEVDNALKATLRQLNPGPHPLPTSSGSYRRQSKLDPRFAHMGIGKRYGPKLDPYNFPAGLGKRYIQGNSDAELGENYLNMDETKSLQFLPYNEAKQSENDLELSDSLSLLKMSHFHPSVLSFLSKHFKFMTNKDKSELFLEDERRKLQKRREELNSFLALTDVSR